MTSVCTTILAGPLRMMLALLLVPTVVVTDKIALPIAAALTKQQSFGRNERSSSSSRLLARRFQASAWLLTCKKGLARGRACVDF
jgi:hypothetical protein